MNKFLSIILAFGMWTTPVQPTPSVPSTPPTVVEPTVPDEPEVEPPVISQGDQFNKITKTVIDDLSYDRGTSSLKTALKTGKGNCLTYSLYVKIACDAVGIPCEIIYGTADPSSMYSGMHIWNRVEVDGVTYWCDTSSADYMGTNAYAKTTTFPASAQNYKKYLYILGTDGSVKQLSSASLSDKGGEVVNQCSAASMTAKQVKSDYSTCYAAIAEKVK